MKISPEIYQQMRDDIKEVVRVCKTGDTLASLWYALNIVSRNRAFDDTHPAFASGHWQRVLPFDGRDYCWYYANGCNDTHVETALRKIMTEI